ncbi:MBL fold metallo-hydrolase [Synechococcus sp. PCC 6716]|nr:MBL fold metallo-hydrolase [Synechococcus sp. PCC 6716]
MQLTWLESNTWLWQLGQTRILVDPWLVGRLTFGHTPWLFAAERTLPCEMPAGVELIVLSQGLPDHCHVPTLRQCDRRIPVIGSASAAKIAQGLGFETVITLAPHDTYCWRDVTIQATKGATIGPLQQENGYLFYWGDRALYYEPHGCHDPWLKSYGTVDVVITPLLSVRLPLVGAILNGGETALELAQWLRPQQMISTAANGSLTLRGILPSLLSVAGSLQDLQQQFERAGLRTQLIEPVAYSPLEITSPVVEA